MSKFEFDWSEVKEVSSEEQCKGLVFRGYSNRYVSKDGSYHTKEGMRLLKRKSCGKCPSCDFLLSSIKEAPDNVILPQIENDALYSVHVTNESRDWETGYIDDYDIEFFEINDDNTTTNP